MKIDIPADRELTRSDMERLRRALQLGRVSPQELSAFFFERSEFIEGHEAVADHLTDKLLDVELEWQEMILDNPPNTFWYVPTKTSRILETLDRVEITKDSVVYDVGSGLGKPSLLIGLLTGARVIGIEWEGKYCARAMYAAEALKLENVSFVHDDARNVDFADADVFFMYTPFFDDMLEEFLRGNILPVARKKPVTVVFHGPNSHQLSKKKWFVADETPGKHGIRSVDTHQLRVFKSNPELAAKANQD
jgi:SAM-dependent methyltransferase